MQLCRKSNDLRKKEAGAIEIGKLELYIKRSDSTEPKSYYFVRRGMTIPAIGPRTNNRGIDALVLIDDKNLSSYLGDTEDASHMEWSNSAKERVGKNWNTKYFTERIGFCRRIVDTVVELLERDDGQKDRTSLMEYFSSEKVATFIKTEYNATPPKNGKKVTELPTPPDTPREELWWSLTGKPGGFVIKRNKSVKLPENSRILLTVAYDLSTGSGQAFRKWSPFDFNFQETGFFVSWRKEGIELKPLTGNKVELKITEEDFYFEGHGFDQSRDLQVRVDQD